MEKQVTRYTNLQIGPYSAGRFEVQGDYITANGFTGTRMVAVFSTLAEAQAFVASAA